MEHKPEPKMLVKGIVQLIMKIQALITPRHLIPDLYDLFFPVKHNIYFEKSLSSFSSIHWKSVGSDTV